MALNSTVRRNHPVTTGASLRAAKAGLRPGRPPWFPRRRAALRSGPPFQPKDGRPPEGRLSASEATRRYAERIKAAYTERLQEILPL